MASPNANTRQILNEFASLPGPPGYAIFLKGPWGVGKTYFIKDWMEKFRRQNASGGEAAKNDGMKALYVSLFGLTSTAAIDQEFYRQLNPLMTSKAVTALKKTATMLVKATTKLDINEDGKDDVSISVQLPSLDVLETIKNGKAVIVFDDLERCLVEPAVILGYINYLVEHGEQKVILIGNEEKIEENKISDEDHGDTDGGQDSAGNAKSGGLSFRLTKEKTIGRTLEIEPNFGGGIACFIDYLGKSKAFVKSNQDLISKIFDVSETKNLRHLKFGLLEFERLFASLPTEAREKGVLCRRLLASLLTLIIETRGGDLQVTDLTMLDPYRYELMKLAKPNKRDKFQELKAKYLSIPELDLDIPLLKSKTWKDILGKGFFCSETIEKDLYETSFFDDKRPSWIQLRDWIQLGDDQFSALFEKVWQEYEKRKFEGIDEFLGVTRLLFNLEAEGLLPFLEIGRVIKEADDYLDSLGENLPDDWLTYKLSGSSSGGNDELKRFLNSSLQPKLVRGQSHLGAKLAKSLISSLTDENMKEFQALMSFKGKYARIPILHHLDCRDVVNRFASLDITSRRIFGACLVDRFRSGLVNITEEENQWLKSLDEAFQVEIGRRVGRVSGHSMKAFRDDFLCFILEGREAQPNVGA